MTQKSSRPPHDRSISIKDNENNGLIHLIEKEDGVTLATAAIQLWFSQKPAHTQWFKAQTGVICFIKDYTKKSYFFRLYSLTPSKLWEQEMYTPFGYNQLTKSFHYFAADECNAGFNFAKEEEAEKFYTIVMNKIMSKTTKKKSVSSVSNQENINTSNSQSAVGKLVLSNQPITLNSHPQPQQPATQSTGLFGSLGDSNKFGTIKSNKKKKIDKSQISCPTAFRIVQHVGLSSASNNFEVNLSVQDESSKKMREILEKLNMPINKKTEAFVDNYIKNHGGLDRFDEELRKQVAQPSNKPNFQPEQQQTQPVIHNRAPNPPPPRPPPSQPTRMPPPPPPPIPPTIPPQFQNNPSSSGIPPPPPPPPSSLPVVLKQSPKPDVNTSGVTSAPSPPAPPPPPPPPPPPMIVNVPKAPIEPSLKKGPPPPQFDPRSQLLDSIKGFSGFSKANPAPNRISDPQPAAEANADTVDILDQLKNELLKRAQFLNDSSDDEDGSDSEWQ